MVNCSHDIVCRYEFVRECLSQSRLFSEVFRALFFENHHIDADPIKNEVAYIVLVTSKIGDLKARV